MTKAILLDFWGTLVENGVWSPIKQVKRILNIQLPFPEYVVRMERAMMTEKFDSLKNAFQNVCREFNLKCDEEIYEELIGMWNKSWMLAHPYEEVDETLTKLGKKYKLILITNTDCFSVKNVMDKFALQKFFSRTFLSCEVNMLKNDKNFLKHVLDELNLDIEDCFLVGDSIQSDMIAAKKIGIKAALIDRRGSREYSPKIKDLKGVEHLLKE